MDYSKYAPTTKKIIHIRGKLIEFDQETWQIKNIFKISMQKIKLPFEIEKPTFDKPQPQLKRNLIPALGIFAGGLFLSIAFLSNWIYLLTIAASLGTILFSIRNSKAELEEWNKGQDDHEKRLNKWNEIKKNPQIIYALSFEPNKSDSPLFYSHDGDTCENIVRSIKEVMAQCDEIFIDYPIDIIIVEKNTTIMEVGAAVYDKIDAKFFKK